MYRVVIGDDDPGFLRELEDTVLACLAADGLARGEEFELACFQDPDGLAEALLERGEDVSLLLLDIEFGEANGLALAARLRERDRDFSLVYITSHEDYVFDSFDTRPLHYLLKPLQKEKLAALLREDYRRRFRDDRLYLKSGGRHLSLPYRDIYAVEAAGHRVVLHTGDGPVDCAGPLSALAHQLPGWCFCQCHFSYYINLSHVTALVRYQATLDNGAVIPISKRFYKSAFEQYLSFLRK